MNSRPLRLFFWRRSQDNNLRADAHQLAQAVNFLCFDPNAALPFAAPLQVVDRDPMAANQELADPAAAEPIVERRHGDSEAIGGFGGGKEVVGHGNQPAGCSRVSRTSSLGIPVAQARSRGVRFALSAKAAFDRRS